MEIRWRVPGPRRAEESVFIVKGHQDLPSGGHEFCPLMATRSAQWWPSDVPGRLLVQGDHSLPGEGLGEADAVAAGLADVGVVHQPVDSGGGQGLGHQLVESIRGWHMLILVASGWCLGYLSSGVSADL
jgi:hypothetical protein